MAGTRVPLPPSDLASRVGSEPGSDPLDTYERAGAGVRERIDACLPAGWSFEGKRVLDFGCGAARVLRHFLPEAQSGEFWGCDIDGESVDWINANLNPPLRAFRNGTEPPLEIADGFFDLIYATSVFTHIGERWSDWLLEMHRVLAPGGVFFATFLGEAMWEDRLGEPYREDEVGMAVTQGWLGSDAAVFHSEWWLREHWGRAFEIDSVEQPPLYASPASHGYVVCTKREAPPDKAAMERIDPAEPRELAALQTNVRLLERELETLAREKVPAPELPEALRQVVRASPVAGPARSVRRRLRARGRTRPR